MDIKDVYIPDQNYQGTEEELQHGRKWSEEAKERVRQARKAGRSVRDMFASFYTKQSRSLNKSLNKVANRTIYKKSISNARNKLVVAKSNRDLSYKRGVALKNSSSRFVSKGSSPVEKGRRAGIAAKLKRDNDVDKMVKDATVRYRKKELKKSSKHSTGRIVKDATKAISKDVTKKANKLSKDVGKTAGKLSKDVGKGINNTVRTIDKSITSAVNKGVANKDRKYIDKEEKKYIDKRRKSALNVAVKSKKYINKQYEEAVNKANREANIESVKNAFNFINGKEKEKKIYEKRKKALKKAKSQADNHWSEATKDVRKSIKDAEERTVDKYKYSSVKDITDKNVRSLKKKVGKTLNDINTNKGKGYKLTGKTKVSAKGGYERYASDAERGDVYGKRKVSVIKEGKRANSITDALTGKTNDYKEYSTKTEYKMWKEPKKKSKPKSKRKNKLRQSALNDVYIPGKVGTSEVVLHSDTFGKEILLKHAGVKGMKWGVRRARVTNKSAKKTQNTNGKISTKKERKRLGISKEYEEEWIKDIIRKEAKKNNVVSYRDVKASLKKDYNDLIELEDMDA